jgi:hypothetical protein
LPEGVVDVGVDPQQTCLPLRYRSYTGPGFTWLYYGGAVNYSSNHRGNSQRRKGSCA